MTLKKTEEWDAHEEVRKLVERNDELKALYKKLGYSPHIERQSREVIRGLKDLLRTEILDFAAFQRVLNEVGGVRFADRSHLDGLMAALCDKGKVLELLNSGGLSTELPYQLKAFTRTQVTHPARFARLLDDLAELYIVAADPDWGQFWDQRQDDPGSAMEAYEKAARNAARSRRNPISEGVREEIAYAIAGVRQELQRDGGDIETSLNSLESEVESAMRLDHDDAAQEKKDRLDDLLWNLIYAHHEYKPDDAYYKQTIQEQAKNYLDSTWIHTPWITTHMLRQLLDAELAAVTPKKPSEKLLVGSLLGIGLLFLISLFVNLHWHWLVWPWLAYLVWYYWQHVPRLRKARVLQLIRDEVAAGGYDGEEAARRLRQLEERGVYVHSLTYPLIRLGGTPPP